MGEGSESSRPSTPRPEFRQFDFDDLDALEDAADGCGAALAGRHEQLEDVSTEASADPIEEPGGEGIPLSGKSPAVDAAERAPDERWRTSESFWSSHWRVTAKLAKELLTVRSELELRDAEPRSIPQPEAERSHVWEVVGGRGDGGVIVRKGRRACSLVEPVRLAPGARVRELALEGGRLQYRRLSGKGPDTGWVSTSVSRPGSREEAQLLRLGAPAEPARAAAAPRRRPEEQRPSAEGSAAPSDAHAGSDPVASCVRSGTRHVAGAFCDSLDMSLFELLRAEISRIQRDKNLPTKNGIWSSLGHRLPAHDFVLRKLMATFCAEGLSWASNLYEAASVPCGFHHDGSKYGGDSHNPHHKSDITMIASFGATRDLTLRHDDTGREFAFPQKNGDMFAFYKEVDDDYVHGLHPEKDLVEPRISVVIIGRRREDKSDRRWAPRFKSNLPLGLDAGSEPRLIQFSGVFVSEEAHMFLPQELRRLAAHGTRAADAFFDLHGEWLLHRSRMRDGAGPAL